MKLKKTFLFMVLIIGTVSLMLSSSCNKDDDCGGYVTAKTSGALSSDFCFDRFVSYDYYANDRVSLVVGEESSMTYSFDLSVHDNTGTGTFQCGPGNPGFVEIVVHGSDNEFYQSQSGTITVSKVSDTGFEGSFDVDAVGYNNGKSVKISGTFKYNK